MYKMATVGGEGGWRIFFSLSQRGRKYKVILSRLRGGVVCVCLCVCCPAAFLVNGEKRVKLSDWRTDPPVWLRPALYVADLRVFLHNAARFCAHRAADRDSSLGRTFKHSAGSMCQIREGEKKV